MALGGLSKFGCLGLRVGWYFIQRKAHMSVRIVQHLRNNVVGYVALFFAMGVGTAWALGANSVKSKHIVNDQVKSADVRDDVLPGGGLTGDDIKESTLVGVRLPGNTYRSATANTGLEASDNSSCDAGETCKFKLGCNPGDGQLSAGFGSLDAGTRVTASHLHPSDLEAWYFEWENDGTVDELYFAGLCILSPSP